ncbi:hypothetical protein LEP1GSC084_1684 [Leptospira interrogans serovar Medanensis str. L0448]|nr:hypothetical protein LEP1GSC084_1684 [Leptospira interrogans serovar Medanensis str. L0448]
MPNCQAISNLLKEPKKFYFIIKLIIVFSFKIYLIEFLYISIDL